MLVPVALALQLRDVLVPAAQRLHRGRHERGTGQRRRSPVTGRGGGSAPSGPPWAGARRAHPRAPRRPGRTDLPQHREHLVRFGRRRQDRGGQQPQPQGAHRLSATSSASRAGSSARTYAAARPTRTRPCRRATSRTRYSSGCGTPVEDSSARKARASSAVAPSSSPRARTSGRTGRRSPRPGSPPCEGLQPPGQRRLERTGRDGREVGLQQDLAHRRRQRGLQRPRAPSSSPASRARRPGGQRTGPQDPEPARVPQRPRHQVLAQPARPARSGPPQPVREARRVGGVSLGQRASSASTACRTAGAEARSRSAPRALRGESFASRVPTIAGTRVDGSHAETSVSQRSPGPPPATRRRPGSAASAVRPRGRRRRARPPTPSPTTSAGRRLVDLQRGRRPSQVPHAEAPARSTEGPAVPHQRPSSATSRHASVAASAEAASTCGSRRVASSSAPVPSAPASGARARAQRQTHLARQDDGPRTGHGQQPVREQPLDRAARRGRAHLPVGALHGSRRRPPGELVEDGAHAVGGVLQEPSTVPGAARCVREPGQRDLGVVADLQARSSSSSASRCGERRPSASATGPARRGAARGARGRRRRGAAGGPCPTPGPGGAARRRRRPPWRPTPSRRRSRSSGRAAPTAPRPPAAAGVEALERALGAGARGRPRGQRRGRRRQGSGEVGARGEQGPQVLVRAGAQVLGEGARGRLRGASWGRGHREEFRAVLRHGRS